MAQKVTVQISGTQKPVSEAGEAEEHTRQIWPGVYSFQNGKHFVLYEEDDGEGNRTRSTIKADRNGFEVIKRGAVRTCLIFRTGGEHVCRYETPFGPLPMKLKTQTVEVELPEDTDKASGPLCLSLTACYVLEWDKEPAAFCRVCIRVCEA